MKRNKVYDSELGLSKEVMAKMGRDMRKYQRRVRWFRRRLGLNSVKPTPRVFRFFSRRDDGEDQ